MVYKVTGGKSFVFQALQPGGNYVQLGTGAKDRSVAKDIAHMWEKLAQKRAWDLLQPILGAKGRARARLLLGLYDLWVKAKGDVETVRRLQRDRNVEPLVAEWETWYRGEVEADTVDHAVAHCRWLLPEGASRLVSEVTTDWLTQRLTAYEGKRNTRRKVHSSWSGFFGYLTRVHKLWPKNPMDDVPRPTAEESPIRFYELDVVERIVGWQPTEARRALMAFLYGTACDLSVALRLTRRDFFNPDGQEVRTAGTKTSTRDRVSRVADWAWPTIWAYVRTVLPDTRLWSFDRWAVSDWHRQTVGVGTKDTHGKIVAPGLNLAHRHPLHCARDHWAVRYLRSGGAIQVVAAQLGHRDPNLTLKKYGRFIPSGIDRERMEQQATAYEERRRQHS